jgi:DNA-binding GntR family transcriptional regulator
LFGDRLVDRIAELMRDRIMEARYAPGEPLPRRRLAEELSVGSTVVGEALRVLGREGLVCPGARGEMRVTLHDRRLLLDAHDLRSAIEGLGARLAALRDESFDRALQRALDEQREAIEIDDSRRFVRADIAFHAALLDRSGNLLLRSCVALVRWTSRSAPLGRPRMRQALAEHEAILAAIRNRDPEEAERAARAHISATAYVAESAPRACADGPDSDGPGEL